MNFAAILHQPKTNGFDPIQFTEYVEDIVAPIPYVSGSLTNPISSFEFFDTDQWDEAEVEVHHFTDSTRLTKDTTPGLPKKEKIMARRGVTPQAQIFEAGKRVTPEPVFRKKKKQAVSSIQIPSGSGSGANNNNAPPP